MAIYRTGQASMDAQGYITGYNTGWRKQLTLIRSGATIVFNTSPVSFAVISEVISDTEMRAIQTGGKVIDRSDYVILLHDSLTVDGLAQDVAETLRYYQGKETQFERFIEIIHNMDPEELEKFLEGVKAEADRAEAAATKSHQSSLTAQAASTVASEQADRAKQQVELAAAEVGKAKDQVVLAANEVKKASEEVEKAKAQVTLANNASDFASEQASNAADAAGRSTVEAERAAAAAKKAEDLAGNLDAANLLRKDKNLEDLTDKAAARRNLGVDNITSDNTETRVMTKGKDAWLSLRQADRKWGFWDEAMKSWHSLGVEQGGTGAKDAAGARANIGVDRVVQDSNMTRIKSADPKTELRIGQDDWYVYRDSQDSEAGFVALGLKGGGTGANDAAGAKANLELDRFKQFGQVTSMQSGNGKFSVIVTDSSAWGGWSEDNQSYVPLGVLQGGTGAGTAQGARNNLGVPSRDEALLKSDNLAGIANRAAAWLNVRPLGSTPLSGDPVNDNDAVTKRWVENFVSGGVVGATMNGVQNYGVGEKTLWDSRAFIPQWAVAADGQILNRADWPELWAHAKMHSPISDSEWLSTASKRGMWSTGDGSTTFRCPDLNGVQSGSIKGLYGRGDGGGSYAPGSVYESAAPNVTGTISFGSATGFSRLVVANSGSGALYGGGTTGTDIQLGSSTTGAGSNRAYSMGLDLSLGNPVYGRSSNEVRPNSFAGVWIIRASGGFIAANTSWSVIDEGNSDNVGTWVNGGVVRSTYKIKGKEVAACSMYLTEAIDSSGYRNAKAQFAVSNKQGNEYFFNFNEKGVFQTSNGRFVFDHDVYSNGSVNAGVAGVVRSRAAESNEIGMQAAPAGQGSGYYINYVQGKWYNGRWTIGGVRGTSTNLDRVQLDVSDGVTVSNSYIFRANGIASAVQWQSTSDARVKSLIEKIPNPLEVMKSIHGYSWYYEPWGTQGFGFMAHEVEEFFPGAVSESDGNDIEMPDGSIVEKVKSVDTYGVAAALHHEAILELMKQMEEMKEEIANLKKQLNSK